MESLLLYLWALFNCLFGLPQVHQKPPTSPPLLQGHIPPPPAPEPITVIELPLPPVAPDNREGSCSSEVNPARTGCIGRTTQIQSGNFLPDNLHVLSMVHFVGAPAAPDPASIFQGEQLIIIKIDGTLFANGDSWRCITCGVPDHNSVGATSKLDYPQAFRDGRRILAGANIIQAAHGFTGDDLTPDQVHIIPIRWKTTADNSGPGGSMRELRLHPDDVHLGWSAFSFDTGSLGQYCYYGRLAFSPSPSSGLPLAPRYDLTSVNLLYDPVASQPLAVHPTDPSRLLLNASAISVGELRGFSASGKEVTYVGSPSESSNIDVFAADLVTGAVRRLTSHPEYVDPVDLSPEGGPDGGAWTVVMDTRGSGRQMFLAGLRRIPPLTDLVTVAAVASVRNNGYRRFFQPWLIDRHGDRGTYMGQKINAAGDGIPGGGAINDPEWNGMADPKWSGDGTRIAYWQALTRSPACGGDNLLPCYESTAQGGRTARLMVAHLTSRPAVARAAIEVAADVVPWGTMYVPGVAAPRRLLPGPGAYTLFGRAAGWANVTLAGKQIGGPIEGVKVEYYDFSDDGENVLTGLERVAAWYSSPTTVNIDWDSDLDQTGPDAGTKKTSPGGFHVRIDILDNKFEANGTLTTVVGGKTYLQPANGT
ncbi:hypothetical protein D7B24_008014 [Verticillium nonalfalfae]|uniref:Saponin hydrolase n=1 Tax=Verticillium nonalfalfae TaxID=1051616 RepID=A0A3M9Y5S6_9PEZI|nr:uncharacterized protein D7B24_008014 [Verticillium nonalfalfae]RNJ55817.1 hypothetical protein D7B24_008014 [Verticillium nonalfalfae]